jgi:hypothetical protein
MNQVPRIDKKAVRRGKLSEQGNDFDYWQSQPPEARLAAIEMIRTEFNGWKYGSRSGLQRVYRIVKQK